VLGNPLPKNYEALDFDWNNPGEFKVSYEIGLAPEVEIPVSDKDFFTFYKVNVTDTLITEQISTFTRRYGKLSQPSVADGNDMVIGNISEIDENNNIVEGGISNKTTVSLEFLKNEEAKKKITGLEVGSSININPADLADDDHDLMKLLGIGHDHEKLDAVRGKDFRFVVTDIRRMDAADLNQELFDKVLGAGVASDEETFKKVLRERMELGFNRDAEYVFKRDLRKAVIEKLDYKLPEDFLKKWIKASNEKPLTDEILDTEFPLYLKDLRWQLVENKLIRDNKLTVTQDEAVNHVMALIAQQYAQYGIPTPAEDELRKNAITALSKTEDRNKIFQDLYADKVVSHLATMVGRTEQEIDADSFIKIANQQ